LIEEVLGNSDTIEFDNKSQLCYNVAYVEKSTMFFKKLSYHIALFKLQGLYVNILRVT
jgi:hypothetical protein